MSAFTGGPRPAGLPTQRSEPFTLKSSSNVKARNAVGRMNSRISRISKQKLNRRIKEAREEARRVANQRRRQMLERFREKNRLENEIEKYLTYTNNDPEENGLGNKYYKINLRQRFKYEYAPGTPLVIKAHLFYDYEKHVEYGGLPYDINNFIDETLLITILNLYLSEYAKPLDKTRSTEPKMFCNSCTNFKTKKELRFFFEILEYQIYQYIRVMIYYFHDVNPMDPKYFFITLAAVIYTFHPDFYRYINENFRISDNTPVTQSRMTEWIDDKYKSYTNNNKILDVVIQKKERRFTNKPFININSSLDLYHGRTEISENQNKKIKNVYYTFLAITTMSLEEIHTLAEQFGLINNDVVVPVGEEANNISIASNLPHNPALLPAPHVHQHNGHNEEEEEEDENEEVNEEEALHLQDQINIETYMANLNDLIGSFVSNIPNINIPHIFNNQLNGINLPINDLDVYFSNIVLDNRQFRNLRYITYNGNNGENFYNFLTSLERKNLHLHHGYINVYLKILYIIYYFLNYYIYHKNQQNNYRIIFDNDLERDAKFRIILTIHFFLTYYKIIDYIGNYIGQDIINDYQQNMNTNDAARRNNILYALNKSFYTLLQDHIDYIQLPPLSINIQQGEIAIILRDINNMRFDMYLLFINNQLANDDDLHSFINSAIPDFISTNRNETKAVLKKIRYGIMNLGKYLNSNKNKRNQRIILTAYQTYINNLNKRGHRNMIKKRFVVPDPHLPDPANQAYQRPNPIERESTSYREYVRMHRDLYNKLRTEFGITDNP